MSTAFATVGGDVARDLPKPSIRRNTRNASVLFDAANASDATARIEGLCNVRT